MPSPVSDDKVNPFVFARIPICGRWIPALHGTVICTATPAGIDCPRPTISVRYEIAADAPGLLVGAKTSNDVHCCIQSAEKLFPPDPPREAIGVMPEPVKPGNVSTSRSYSESPMLRLKVNETLTASPARDGVKSRRVGGNTAPTACVVHKREAVLLRLEIVTVMIPLLRGSPAEGSIVPTLEGTRISSN